jgi:anti-anti-sigma factor
MTPAITSEKNSRRMVITAHQNLRKGVEAELLDVMGTFTKGKITQHLIIDLSKIQNMNSTSLGYILNFYKAVEKAGKSFVLVVSKSDYAGDIGHLLKITLLHKIFTIEHSLADAEEYLEKL